ncbi:MAG: RHS repeat domain-containing protein, partial [Candidatus Fimadaptatus sp.]
FAVNELGDPTEVKVGNQLLSRNVYSPDAERRLECVEFGNGGKISYTYDDFDRVTGIKYDDLDADVSCRYGFLYGANGEISQIGDNNLRTTLYYERDMSERIARIKQTTNTASPGYDIHLTYDDFNNVSKRTERIGAIDSGATLLAYTAEYKYDKDNRPTEIKYDSSNARITHSYDALGRAHQRKVYGSSASTACLSTTYEYLDGAPISGVSAKSTTPLVSAIMQDGVSYEYEYDNVTSNLITERRIQGKEPTVHDKYARYEYDKLGQLVRVNDMNDTTSGADGTTWVYEYDFGGNVLQKKRYPYQTGELTGEPAAVINYEYADTNWKDKVTSIGGKALSYDAIGNIVNDGEWTYSWQAGKQLKSMNKAGTDIAYDYDHNGIRIRKSVTDASGTVRTEYVVNDKRILHMVHGGENLHFYYDGTGRVSMVSFKGVKYAYVHNLQGDVVGLLDAAGNVVVEYSYDAWGKPIAVTGGMADTVGKLNPFRYRGYVWDEETGLYYLRSRYYRPEWGRFISSDTNMGSEGGFLAHNLYAYCRNNAIAFSDDTGKSPASKIVNAVIDAAIRKGWRFYDPRIPEEIDRVIKDDLDGVQVLWFRVFVKGEVLLSYANKNSYVYIIKNNEGSIWKHEYTYRTYEHYISVKDFLDVGMYFLEAACVYAGLNGIGTQMVKMYNDFISYLPMPEQMSATSFDAWSSKTTPLLLKGGDLWAHNTFVSPPSEPYEVYLGR